jgi:hypothetical protein
MTTKIRIDLDGLQAAIDFLAKLEAVSLADLELTRNGTIVPIDKDRADEWRFMGLNNKEFLFSEGIVKDHRKYVDF